MKLTHLSDAGEVWMVDISAKEPTVRQASASAIVKCQSATIDTIRAGAARKGDVLAVIRLAGIQATKLAPQIIPLAHPIAIHGAQVDIELGEDEIRLRAHVKTADRTGIEMEALTAVTCAALTAIDMIKGIDRAAYIANAQVDRKTGGRSGTFERN
ncbi:MAG: cyclic pyranopterin monophosphate synthase MoaC [Actinomycetaceae bacterium]|nr:cyclic pyranopterin monophosphate synthase MoaC [Actinomycetaceae bacterium]